jgi:hypothetical protein
LGIIRRKKAIKTKQNIIITLLYIFIHHITEFLFYIFEKKKKKKKKKGKNEQTKANLSINKICLLIGRFSQLESLQIIESN